MSVLLASVAAGVSVASASSGTTGYVVTFKAGADPDAIAADLRKQGRAVAKVYRKVVSGLAVDLSDTDLATLRQNPLVERIEPDVALRVAAASSSTSGTTSGATWGIDRSDQRALPLSGTFSAPATAGRGVYVYVVDTGVRSTHSELAGRVATGYTALADGRGTEDCDGHGTHVAATAAGTTLGMAANATIVPVRVMDCTGVGTLSGVVAGLDYIAADTTRRPAVLNMSVTGSATTIIDDAINRVIASGVTVVVAAGNDSVDGCNRSPSRVPAALTVGATTSTDAVAAYSNWGTCLDLFAPGTSVVSAWYTSDTATATMSGTSMAAPHVAGAAALLLGEAPRLTPSQVASTLTDGATPNVLSALGVGSPNKLLFADPTLKAPANDAFGAAADLMTSSPAAVGSGSVVAGNTNASSEAGEPAHAGRVGGASIWYSFTPATTAPLTLTTKGSGFDTLLGVYTGSSLDALTEVASNDNATGVTWSSVQFLATAGRRYLIAVDGVAASNGPVTLTWSIAGPISVATTTLPAASTGVSYSTQLAAGGGTGSASWSVPSGTLPPGLSLSPAGVLSGVPTTVGSFPVTVAVTDGYSSATATLTLAVATPVTVAGTTLPSGAVSRSYSATLSASGGTGTYTWRLASGSLPTGLTLSTSGSITGTPTAGGLFTFIVSATDSAGRSSTATLSIKISTALAISSATLPAATLSQPYSTTLVATGGSEIYTWKLSSGTLPSGLGLSSAGVVSGTPGTAGTFTFGVAVSDGLTTVTKNLTLAIATAVTVTTASLAAGKVGTAYAATLAASGGSGTYTWSLVSGALPSGISLSSSGAFSGAPTAAGTFSFTVGVKDAAGRSSSKALSIVVAASLPGAFSKSSPSSAATGVSRTSAVFTWTAAAGATSYEFCLTPASTTCGATGSTGWVSVGTALTTTRTGLASKTVYYWQVRAVNSAGSTLANSGTSWKFTSAT